MKKKKNNTTVSVNNFTAVIKHKTKKQIQRRLKWRRAMLTFKQGVKDFLHLLKKDKRFLSLIIINFMLIIGTSVIIFSFKCDIFLSFIKPNYFLSSEFFVSMLTIFLVLNFIVLIMQNHSDCITKKRFIKLCVFYGVYVILTLSMMINFYGIATLLAGLLVYFSVTNVLNLSKFRVENAICITFLCLNLYFFAVLYGIFMLN